MTADVQRCLATETNDRQYGLVGGYAYSSTLNHSFSMTVSVHVAQQQRGKTGNDGTVMVMHPARHGISPSP